MPPISRVSSPKKLPRVSICHHPSYPACLQSLPLPPKRSQEPCTHPVGHQFLQTRSRYLRPLPKTSHHLPLHHHHQSRISTIHQSLRRVSYPYTPCPLQMRTPHLSVPSACIQCKRPPQHKQASCFATPASSSGWTGAMTDR